MTETPECRTLNRQCITIGINFHLVAERACFVAVIIFSTLAARGNIEASKFVILFRGITCRSIPTIAAFIGGNTNPGIVLEAFTAVHKDIGPVLFTGNIGAPGRYPVTTVIVGTTGLGTLRRKAGFDVVTARHWPGKFHHRRAGEATVIARPWHVRPLAAGVLFDLNKGNTVSVDFGARLLCWPLTLIRISGATLRRP